MNDLIRYHYLAALGRDLRMPEPPRATNIRIYHLKRTLDRFTLFGEVFNWVCCADVLNLKLNYWEKTPIAGETFYYGDSCLYLVADDDELKWRFDLLYINCGPKYKEDQYDHDKLQNQRRLARAQIHNTMEERILCSLAGI